MSRIRSIFWALVAVDVSIEASILVEVNVPVEVEANIPVGCQCSGWVHRFG